MLSMPFNPAPGLARALIIMRAAAPITGPCEAQPQSSLHLHIKHTTSPHTRFLSNMRPCCVLVLASLSRSAAMPWRGGDV